MMYIGLTSIPDSMKRKIPEGEVIKVYVEREEAEPLMIKRGDLFSLILINLGNIAGRIYKSIETAATSEKYA